MQLIYEKPLNINGNGKLIIKNTVENEQVDITIYNVNDIKKLNAWFDKLKEDKK